jgi:hypothetical protein
MTSTKDMPKTSPQGRAHPTFRYQRHVELKMTRRSTVDFGNWRSQALLRQEVREPNFDERHDRLRKAMPAGGPAAYRCKAEMD